MTALSLRENGVDPRRVAPVLAAGLLGAVYVIISPPSLDLAAHLLRAQQFRVQGFGIWSNWWYGGHHLPGYSVLFPAAAAASSPQLAGALAATATAAVFEPWARERFGPDAWLGSLWFGIAMATNLFTGRLAFAFGLLPAVAAAWALSRRRTALSCGLGVLTALCSPVSALFSALAGAAQSGGALLQRRARKDDAESGTDELGAAGPLPGIALVAASLVPVGILAITFPEGGTEPFTLATLAPILGISLIAAVVAPHDAFSLRAGAAVYAVGCLAAYALPTPVGSNMARLGALVAGPLAALLWRRSRPVLLLLVALPLAYIQWQASVRDVTTADDQPSVSLSYYRPLLGFLARQKGPPFRVEIPFTLFHWEAYEVAPRFPLARGWERQLDIKYNHLFYDGRLTAAKYEAWLHQVAVRFVASSDAQLDYSAHAESTLIKRGLPYLEPVFESRHWRVYEVRDATPIVTGGATLASMDIDSLTLDAKKPGTALVRVRFTPYWAIGEGFGCVEPAGDFTAVKIRDPGRVRLVIRFAVGRIGAHSPRCN